MKPGRQSVILEIISQQNIETQNQLLDALSERGIRSTQATLSRDIKDMRLVKELGENGKYKYSASQKPDSGGFETRLRTILKESVTSYDIAQNIVIIKTLPGLAPAACAAIDGMDIDGLAGTLAGDDTAFLAMHDNELAVQFYHEIEKLI